MLCQGDGWDEDGTTYMVLNSPTMELRVDSLNQEMLPLAVQQTVTRLHSLLTGKKFYVGERFGWLKFWGNQLRTMWCYNRLLWLCIWRYKNQVRLQHRSKT